MFRFLFNFFLFACLSLAACGQNEQTQQKLFEEIVRRSAINDSLKRDLIRAGGKINRLQVLNDSLQKSGEVFRKKIQQLDREAKKYRSEAEARRRANDKLQAAIKQKQAEIHQLERKKYADGQEINKLRGELNGLFAKLDRQQKIIEEEKKRVQEARQNQNSVRLLVGTERYLKAYGFLKTGRTAFLRKSYKLVKKPTSDNSRVKIVPIGESVNIRSGLKALVGYNGKLKNGDDYRMKKHGWSTTITFTNRVLGGTSVLAIVED